MDQGLQPKSELYVKALAVCYAEILSEMIEWGPLCTTDLFKNKSVAYFNPK
jgi:hypothetical protein